MLRKWRASLIGLLAPNVRYPECIMRKIGILYGMENTFPGAFIEAVNSRGIDGIRAESVLIGGVKMAEPSEYRVIIDRISQDVDFYRAYLKNAVLGGASVFNNPFWWTADDKFFNYSLASKLGVAIPKTVILPQKEHPPGTTDRSMRNLVYPLNWQNIFDYVGFPAFLKPFSGGGWKHVYKVHSPDELFAAYNQTGTICMTLQQGIEFKEYFRCYVIGQRDVRIMHYDPRRPHAERYVLNPEPASDALYERVTKDCITLCRALGYDINTVEFAVQDGVPYAIDFLNPAPDADFHSVGQANFEWFVNKVADFAIEEAQKEPQSVSELRWSKFLNANESRTVSAVG